MNKVSVGVLGASGYTGRELCALISRHPAFHLSFAAAHSRAGEKVRVGGRYETLIAAEEARLDKTDLIFSALPHGASAKWVKSARNAGAKVVDLSSDLRPGQPVYSPDFEGDGNLNVPYGLTELTRQSLAGASLVANPGCYPTAILIALAPLLKHGLVPAGEVITVSAASGTTGAGFTPRPELLFSEVAEDFKAYGVGNQHRHLNEMQAAIKNLGGDNDIIFTPHLLPVARGILASITVPLTEKVDAPLSLWKELYKDEPFVEVCDSPPSLRDVVHRNVVSVHATLAANVRRPTMCIFAAIDNLVKGAAGQAIQNANVMFDISETTGLTA